MATPAGHRYGRGQGGQRSALAAAEEPLEPHAVPDAPFVDATARQRPVVSRLSAQGNVRRYPEPPASQCRQGQAQRVAELGQPQPTPWIRRGRPYHPPAPGRHCGLHSRFLTRMYARFGAMAGPPCSDRGCGCNSLLSGSHRLYGSSHECMHGSGQWQVHHAVIEVADVIRCCPEAIGFMNDELGFVVRFLTRMYARFGAMAGPPCSDRGCGCNSLLSGSHRLYE